MLAGLGLTAYRVKEAAGWDGKLGRLVEAFCGFNFVHDMTWRPETMTFTWPVVAGVGASVVASKTGANRYTPKGFNI